MASAGSSDQEQKNTAADSRATMNTEVDAAENKQEGNEKKMREIIMPQREVDYVLSYEPEPCDPETAAWLEAFHPGLYALFEKEERRMLAEQENFKRQITSKGYISMMVEVHDDDDDDEEEDKTKKKITSCIMRR